MSKTIRRKKGKLPIWVTHDLVWKDHHSVWEPLSGKDLAKAVNKYHADKGTGWGWMGRAPSDFRRDCNREFRSKMNQETRRILKHGDYWDYEFRPFKKDAGWLYW